MISISEQLIKSVRVSSQLHLHSGDADEVPRPDPNQSQVNDMIDHSPPLDQLLSVIDSPELLNAQGNADKTIDEENEETNGADANKKDKDKGRTAHAARRLVQSLSVEPLFQRESVPAAAPASRLSGLLATQLTESSFMRQSRVFNATPAAAAAEEMAAGASLLVFPVPDEKPVKLRLPAHALVAKVIELAIAQWRTEGRDPPLRFSDAAGYELRMVDDDEGNPDEDMPPLEYTKEISLYGVDAVAMVEKEDYEPTGIEHSKLNQRTDFRASISLNQRASAIGSIVAQTAAASSNLHSPALALAPGVRPSFHARSATSIVASPSKLFVKVFTAAHESVILNLARDSSLIELLALVCKKKALQLTPEDCKFAYLDTAKFPSDIDWQSTVADLKTDEIRLIVKSDGQGQGPGLGLSQGSATGQTGPIGSPSSAAPPSTVHSGPINLDTEFQFTLDTAAAYSEYKVIKTNDRGKRQTRIFGIDRYKIYNKHFRSDSSSAKSALKSAFSFAVQTADRPISSITSISMGEADGGSRANCFTISFREKGKIVAREYEAETNMECAEIVAKIKFLLNYQPENSNQFY